MSNHAAIAAVTATLTNMIQRAVNTDQTVAGGRVTARPPDRARQGIAGSQINLFLYRTSIDAAWRNQDPPSIRPGESGQPPLPLVLSYLITAYGENDDEILSHRLLGIAMGVLNDRPLLSRADIQRALLPGPGSDLENQVERIRITPDPRPQDEISRMWATFGTGYRLSVSYDAAVVLIDSTRPVAAPAPVLRRGSEDRGPFANAQLAPQIDVVLPPNGQAAARPGDPVTLHGRQLDAVRELEVTGIRLAAATALPIASATPDAVVVNVPKPPTLPAGTVAVAARFDDGSGRLITGPAAPLALAPTIVSKSTLKAKLDDTGSATLKIKCAPPVQPGQTLALIVGDQLIVEPPLDKASDELTFTVTGLPAQTYTMRLRVDSVDSIPVAAPAGPNGAAPMQIDPAQQVALT